jgi:hypothetical protein
VSVRSKGKVNVVAIAESLGSAMDQILAEMHKALSILSFSRDWEIT